MTPPAPSPRLEVRDLSVSFAVYAGTVRAVRGVSFTLAEGETLALVGESGSGKTVTCRALMRLLPRNASIDSGQVLFHDDDNVAAPGGGAVRDLLRLSPAGIRDIRGRGIGMIFQDPMTSLDPTMRVGRQIAEAVRLRRRLSRAAVRDRVAELLHLVGIPPEKARAYPHEFSGGQRQRVVIAMVLAQDPRVIIADEPTTALDVTMQAQILDLLKDLRARLRTSIIFITHDLGVVANVADRVAVMYAGRVVEQGRVDEIFYDPCHPYTWGLLQSMPTLETGGGALTSIPGSPPNLIEPRTKRGAADGAAWPSGGRGAPGAPAAPPAGFPAGDPFTPRNPYALEVDARYEPPLFRVTPTHYAATWLLDPRAPPVEPPPAIRQRKEVYRARQSIDNAAL